MIKPTNDNDIYQPLVSVVLPTHNQAHYLPGAIDSVLAQTYQNFELIIVNDGSTDQTNEVLEPYSHHSKIRVINQENKKLPRALNTGFRQAQGQYLTWTSSDNLLHPDMLQILVEALKSNTDIGLVYADRFLIDEHGINLGYFPLPAYDPYLLLHMSFIQCCFLYRRECQEKVGFYDPAFIYAEDWEYWIRISRYFSIKHIPKALYYYRVHRNSMTTETISGTADAITPRDFSRVIRRRMPWRWTIGKMRWLWIKLFLHKHPLFIESKRWQTAIKSNFANRS